MHLINKQKKSEKKMYTTNAEKKTEKKTGKMYYKYKKLCIKRAWPCVRAASGRVA